MYMTPQEAQSRLFDRYAIEATLLIGDVMMASEELREHAPFVESVDLEAPPDALLDWVALRAYQLAEDDEPPVESEGVRGTSITYERAKASQVERRMNGLIAPYQRLRGYRR